MNKTIDESRFLSADSDSDDDLIADSTEDYDKSRLPETASVIDDSDQETSPDRNSHLYSFVSNASDSVVEDRLTSSIVRAIRRSINRFSRGFSDEEDNESGEETEPNLGHLNYSGKARFEVNKNYRKRNVISDDSSVEEDETSVENTVDSIYDSESSDEHSSKKGLTKNHRKRITSDNESSDDEKQIDQSHRDRSYARSNTDESYLYDVHEEIDSAEDESRSFVEDVDSFESEMRSKLLAPGGYPVGDKTFENMLKKHAKVHVQSSSEDELEVSMAISMAKTETMNTTIDPLKAQQKALLIYKRQNIQAQLEKAKETLTIFTTGNMNLLPDRGERLRSNIKIHERELADVEKELETMQLKNSLIVPKRAPLFRNDDLEVDPTYLKPTTVRTDRELGRKAQETMEREQALTIDRLKDLHGSLLARPAEDEKAKDPRGLKVSLMPHQQHALAWLVWRERQKPPGGVLADDMGLGKTLTMIALVMASMAKHNAGDDSDKEDDWQSSSRGQKNLGGTLVVAPASLLAQWEAEVNNRCKRGLLSVQLYHGNNREKVPKRLAKNDIVVTTYNILSREFKSNGVLYKIRWRRVILDEAHVIRNHKSQTCEAVCGLQANKRWALTGTPIHNKEMDLYSIMKFLRCSPFDDVRVWKRWVDNKDTAGHERLATVMKTLMLRRTKIELQAKGELETMTEKTIEIIGVVLDPEERLVYDKVMVYSRTLFAQFLARRAEKNHMFELGAGKYDKPSWMTTYKETQFTKAQNQLLSLHADVKSHEILVLLLRLRQVCCHPSLINAMLDQEDFEQTALEDGGTDFDLLSKMNTLNLNSHIEGDIGVDERVAEHLLTSENPVFDPKRQSSKMRAVLAKIREIMDKGDKIIVVSQWVAVLNVVADELDSIKDASYRMFTGQVAVKDRQGIMDDFNSSRAKPNILLLSLTAGGVGLNLVGANHLLLIDIHWNPQLECQAQDRIYRFGQKKNVYIYKYICEDTIEERIQGLQERKLDLAKAVLSGGGNSAGSKLSLDDIKSLFSL